VAPPNYHLVVGQDGVLWLSGSERTQFVRPSADVLFESVAEVYGPRAIVCVLTGTGRDGAVGVAAVRDHGGTVIAEDPDTAEFSGMPSAAVGTGKVGRVLPLHEIPTAIRDLLVATQP
jgi:two-component system chemotaxis response regulator CheB